MKRWLNTRCAMVFGCMLACGAAGTADARLPPPSEEQKASAAAAKARAQEEAGKQAAALSTAQDRAVENYRRNKDGTSAATATAAGGKSMRKGSVRKVERLSCKLGTEDRHARIAVEVVNGAIQSFAYYSKWKPRTCSVYIVRDDAYSKWKDNGHLTTVTTEKGLFLIEDRRKSVHFIFKDVERERYCGADGKINGTLTVWRGKSKCELNGVMDDDPNEMDRDALAKTVAERSAPDLSTVQR